MKTCFKCGEEKSLTEYYTHKQMADGHLNKCKDCTKKDTKGRTNRLSDDPEWIKSEQARGRDKYYRLYQGIKTPPDTKKKCIENYNSRYPEKVAAKMAMGKTTYEPGIERHHWSYNDEHLVDIIPLRAKDHYTAHRFLEYDQPYKMYRRIDTMELLDTKAKHEAYISVCIKRESTSLLMSTLLRLVFTWSVNDPIVALFSPALQGADHADVGRDIADLHGFEVFDLDTQPGGKLRL